MFINAQTLINILISFAVILLSGLSFSILYFSTKFFNLTQGAIIALGGYFAWWLSTILRVNLLAASLIAISSCILLGIGLDQLVYKRLRQQGIQPIYYLISSIALYTILQNLISAIWGDEAKTLSSAFVNPSHELAGGYITTAQSLLVGLSLLGFISYILFIRQHVLGKKIRAVSENFDLARVHGIDSERILMICTGLGSALGALLGLCMSFDTNITPGFGFNLLLSGVVAMIIGGLGSYRGLLYGSLLIAFLQQIIGFYLGAKWMDCIVYLTLLIFLIWKPFGFSGVRARKIQI